jgi:DNA polymerase-3 subunit delta'
MLYRAVRSERIASAYLFRGPAGVGKLASALDFIRWLKCKSPETCGAECNSCKLIAHLNHPDIELTIPLPKEIADSPESTGEMHAKIAADPLISLSFDKPASIGIDKVRAISEWLALSSTTIGGRWAIIRDAETMTIEAANAFLKTLEEPPENGHIILTSSHPDYLLPTIRSRAQSIAFARMSRDQIMQILLSRGIDAESAENAAFYADGSISTALEFLEQGSGGVIELAEKLWTAIHSKNEALALDFVEAMGQDRSKSLAVIKTVISILRDQILYQIGAEDIAANRAIAKRLIRAAEKFPNPEPIGRAVEFLEKKAYELRYNPQYDLFWMDAVIRAREFVYREAI